MRLTNVTRLSLPNGSLSSLRVEMRVRADSPLPVSFDQRRHVELGDRPGSWMAISFRLPDGTSPTVLEAAWLHVVGRHGTLRTVFSETPAGPQLHSAEVTGAEWVRHPLPEGTPARDGVRAVFDRECRPYAAPSHRVCLLEPDPSEPDGRPIAIIGADHAHVDMWSLLVLARDLLAHVEGVPLDGPVEAFAVHTALLEGMPPAPADVRDEWAHLLAEEPALLPTFPLPLGNLSEPRPEVVTVQDVLDSDAFARLNDHADAQRVRITSLAIGLMAEVTRQLAGTRLRAVFPVHSRFETRWHGAVGWFITNSVLTCDEPDPRAGAAAVKQALRLGSYPLAPVFAPHGGMPAPPGMFALSWLDTRRIPVDLPAEAGGQWISAAIRTDGVMIWFVVNDDGLHLRSRHPDTPEAHASVSRWVDAVARAFQDAARRPVPVAAPIA
ncbi:peptide synthetase [Microbacterium awajiense]|uniref:Peptide synthetase n=1 Tax=Microbacterium awajiense TaxID=415214 RepID=A0ABP7ARM1_9MICO